MEFYQQLFCLLKTQLVYNDVMKNPIFFRRQTKLRKIELKLYPTNDLLDTKSFNNITKVRCIAINNENDVCMISNEGYSNWMIPGGTVEPNENPILALKRELQEEADIDIINYKLIGFLNVKVRNLETNYLDRHTEMFFFARIDKIHSQTADPAKGFILHRKFFSLEQMAYSQMRWGKVSDYIYEHVQKIIQQTVQGKLI